MKTSSRTAGDTMNDLACSVTIPELNSRSTSRADLGNKSRDPVNALPGIMNDASRTGLHTRLLESSFLTFAAGGFMIRFRVLESKLLQLTFARFTALGALFFAFVIIALRCFGLFFRLPDLGFLTRSSSSIAVMRPRNYSIFDFLFDRGLDLWQKFDDGVELLNRKSDALAKKSSTLNVS